MSYAQGSIRDYWDSIGKPKYLEYSAKDYETMYIPYECNEVYIHDCDEQDLSNLKMQFPHYTIDGNNFKGRRGTSIDVDVTYKCNLSCPNCNRASHKHTLNRDTNIDLDYIKRMIPKIKGKIDIVKLVGGEPTLHPDLPKFMALLHSEGFIVWVLTNGILDYKFPDYVYVENSAKVRDSNPMFHTTFLAPIDDERFKNVDYSKGCRFLNCGYAYSQSEKFHICTIGMALSRLKPMVMHQGYDTIEEMLDDVPNYLNQNCRYCGMFKKLGYHNVPKKDFGRTDIDQYSKTWEFLKDVK